MKRFKVVAAESRSKVTGKNEDVYRTSPSRLVVADGASGKLDQPLVFDGKSAGAYLAELISDYALSPEGMRLDGGELIGQMTQCIARAYEEFGFASILESRPEARPSASIAVVTLSEQALSIVQVGDVTVRLNGNGPILLENPRLLDEYHARQRIAALEKLRLEHPDLAIEELLPQARHAIEVSLQEQVTRWQNSTELPWGHGVLDGRPVPSQHIKIFVESRFVEDIETVEIATDGYPVLPALPTLSAWEAAYEAAVREDPYRIGKYPGTKPFPDDRTLVIASVE